MKQEINRMFGYLLLKHTGKWAGVMALLLCMTVSCASRKVADSPEGQMEAEVRIKGSIPFLEVRNEERRRVVSVRLGMNTSVGDFSRNVKVLEQPVVEFENTSYHLFTGKQRKVTVHQSRAVFTLVNASGYRMEVEVRVGRDGVAFRYRLPGKRDIHILKDYTAYTFPDDAKGYFLPFSMQKDDSGVWYPSYEARYEVGVPITQSSSGHKGWCYPALIQSSVKDQTYWTLITETGVRGNYCGTHLAEGDSIGNLHIAYPEKMTAHGWEPDYPVFANATPWRILVVSRELADIVQNTWTTDLVNAEMDSIPEYKAGRATWSWLTMGDDGTTLENQKQFVDLADSLHFEYCLVDAGWDTRLGYDGLQELADYARQRNVRLWVWYNANPNDSLHRTPSGCLDTPDKRAAEMQWLHDKGIAGIKVNFFGGESSSQIRFYEDLLRDANRYGLGVNLHGATLPRGWERMYPNLLTAEAVMGMEHDMTDPKAEKERARHIAMLVYTRNVVAPMDFTPLVLNRRLGIPPHLGPERSTTAVFELALPVLLCSGVQHYGLIPGNLRQFPDYVFHYLESVPAVWDETRLLAGFPGQYAVMARRSGKRWFIAAINGGKSSVSVDVDLSFTGKEMMTRLTSKGADGVELCMQSVSHPLRLKIVPGDGVIFY